VAELVETVLSGPSDAAVVVGIFDWVFLVFQGSWVEVAEGVAADILLKGAWSSEL